MQIDVKTDFKAAEKLMQNAIKIFSDLSPVMKKIGEFQKKEVDEAFKVAGKNINGAPWAPLAPSTLKQKLKSGFQSQILVRTGALRGSFSVSEVGKDKLKISSSGVDYYKYHQMGTGRMPRRQILGHGSKGKERTAEIFREEIIKKITK